MDSQGHRSRQTRGRTLGALVVAKVSGEWGTAMTVGLWVLLGFGAVSAFVYFLIQDISSQLGTETLVTPATSMDFGDRSNGSPLMSFQKHGYPVGAMNFVSQSRAVAREPLFIPGKNLALKGSSKERTKKILVNGHEIYKGPESNDVTLKISVKPGQHVSVVEEFEHAIRPKALKSKSGVTTHPASDGVPVRGLVIMTDPLEKILTGQKTMELRGRHNRQLGKVALIRKSSGHIYGVADIVESVGPMDMNEFRARINEHGVQSSRLQEVFDKGWTIGWRMANVKRLRYPVPYVHKGMSQVKLDDEAVAGLRAALASAIQI